MQSVGRIDDGEAKLNWYGAIVAQCWQAIPNHYPDVVLDEWIVMPNHLHGIVFITSNAHAGSPAKFAATKSGSLATILNRFKGSVTKTICSARLAKELPQVRVWQPRFHDCIIHDEKELNIKQRYIFENPLRWEAHSSEE